MDNTESQNLWFYCLQLLSSIILWLLCLSKVMEEQLLSTNSFLMFAVSLCISVWFKWHQFLFDAFLFLETDSNTSRVLILPRDNKSGYCSKPTVCLAYLSFVGSHSARFSSQLLAGLCILWATLLCLLARSNDRSYLQSNWVRYLLLSALVTSAQVRFACFLRTQVCMCRYLSKQARKQANDGTINHLIDCFLTCFVDRNDDSIDWLLAPKQAKKRKQINCACFLARFVVLSVLDAFYQSNGEYILIEWVLLDDI